MPPAPFFYLFLHHSFSVSLSRMFAQTDMICGELQWERNDVLSNELISILIDVGAVLWRLGLSAG